MTPLERTALHEAGHAVVGASVGLEVPHEVIAHEDRGGCRRWLPTERQAFRMTRQEWRDWQEAMVVVSFAGEAALTILGDTDPGWGAGGDRDRAQAMIATFDPVTPQETGIRLLARAIALAREHQSAIEAFAQSLLANHQRLANYEVVAALGAARSGQIADFGPEGQLRHLIRRRELFDAGKPWVVANALAWEPANEGDTDV